MKPMLRFALVLVGAFVIAAPSLAQPEPKWPPIVTNYVMSTRKQVKTTDMAGYLAAVKNPNGALLLDVREPAEFAAGHVPGAINIPRGLVEFLIYQDLGYPDKKVDTNRKIYVQCKTGGRATLAVAALQKIGFTNVVAVIMNLSDWQKAGNPLVK
jgi:rhodanese-related sulfurtransferase